MLKRMLKRRRVSERFVERRRVEDEAERLAATEPGLRTLRLDVEESREGVIASDSKYVRHIVVAHAPAIFFLPCGDPSCIDGGHDLTASMLMELSRKATSFVLEDACAGHVRTASCERTLRVVATATYG